MSKNMAVLDAGPLAVSGRLRDSGADAGAALYDPPLRVTDGADDGGQSVLTVMPPEARWPFANSTPSFVHCMSFARRGGVKALLAQYIVLALAARRALGIWPPL